MQSFAPEHPYQSGCHDAGVPLRPGGEELTRRALNFAGFRIGERVLDLGCGVGVATRLLYERGCRAHGLDLVAPRLAMAHRSAPELTMVAGDARCLPFANGSFDGMLAECSFSLIGYTAAHLAECRRVLRPGARFAVTDLFARADSPVPSSSAGCLGGMVSRETVLAAFADAGFLVERWEDHSDRLRSFVAQLIFSGAGAEALWACDGADGAEALRARRPGYFLLVAVRQERSH